MKRHSNILCIVCLIFITLLNTGTDSQAQRYKHRFKSTGFTLGYNEIFAGSGECANCHNNQLNGQNQSIAIANDWQSTMMANASKDPFWKAKVSDEIKQHPGLQTAIENKCSSCHAPAGNFNANQVHGISYSMDDLKIDPFGQDGVQCTVCHQIPASDMGTNSAKLHFGRDKLIWGPFENPVGMPMFNSTAYNPQHSNHISSAALCGSCHTLLTSAVLSDGSVSDEPFVEQAVFQEWSNSKYGQEGITCQDCHMPRTDGPVYISDRPPWLGSRDSLSQHHFVGANLLMNSILHENPEQFGINATKSQLEKTADRTYDLLTKKSLTLDIEKSYIASDRLEVHVKLTNLAGHKLPSGFPSRRMWIDLMVYTDNGDVIFHSGKIDDSGSLIGEDEEYEIHHDNITSDEQVQIYELVMGNEYGEKTTGLLKAVSPLKDNRLLPQGFRRENISYDTVKVVGMALEDPDYQMMNEPNGFMSDRIVYEIELPPDISGYKIEARAFYQTLSPEWLEDIQSAQTTETEIFAKAVEDQLPVPVLIASAGNTISNFDAVNQSINIKIFPNPSYEDFWIQTDFNGYYTITVFDILGRQKIKMLTSEKLTRINQDKHSLNPGIYIVSINNGSQEWLKKHLIRNKS